MNPKGYLVNKYNKKMEKSMMRNDLTDIHRSRELENNGNFGKQELTILTSFSLFWSLKTIKKQVLVSTPAKVKMQKI